MRAWPSTRFCFWVFLILVPAPLASCSDDETLVPAAPQTDSSGGGATSSEPSGGLVAGATNGNPPDASTEPGPVCSSTGDACTACINQSCCEELTVCSDDLLCLDILSCVIRCERGDNGVELDPELCRSLCGALDDAFAPSGDNALAYADCRSSLCGETCIENLMDAGF